MEIDFNVEESDLDFKESTGRKFGPGNYEFQVGDASLVTSSKGTRGIKITLLVSHDSNDYKVFDDIWLTEKAKWKYARFIDCIGLDATESLDTDDLLGKDGKLRLRERKDSKYMEVGQYFTRAEAEIEEMGPFAQKPNLESVLMSSDDDSSKIPF